MLAPHLALLNAKLLEVMWGDLKRLMVFMPPRHGKSECISHYFPVVFLGCNPDSKVILSSYEAGFAATWGRKARNTLEEYGNELWHVEVDQTSHAADRWDIKDRRGGMVSLGVGGPITGRGADLLIVDDPVKNSEEARSQVYRQKAWDWWCGTAQTRIEPQGRAVIIQTRWHEDDLSGRLLRDQPGKWEVLNLPAFAEKDDALGREEGEALWPDQWNKDTLLERKREVGSYWWSAQFQQRPAPEEGAIFKREHFRYYTNSGGTYKLSTEGAESMVDCKRCWTFCTVDLAASLKTSADYTVISTWAVTPNNQLLLVEASRVRLEGPDQVPLLWRKYNQWKPEFIVIEKAGYQLALIQQAVRSGLPVRSGIVDKDKVSRALPAAARMEAGQVYFPSGAPWLTDFEEELLGFPNATHDDQVDTLSAAVAEVLKRCAVRFG